MSNIFFCGDPHGNFESVVEAVKQHRPDAIVLLGDMTPEQPLHVELAEIIGLTEIHWIHGNHDCDEEHFYDNLFGSKLAGGNLHGRLITIGGIRIAGMGGVFREKIWSDKGALYDSPQAYLKSCGKGNRWRGGLPLRQQASIFPSEVLTLSKCRADVLVTHEAPAMHQHGSRALTQLAKRLGVKAAFHGHHHEDIVYPDGVWRGVGLQGVTNLDGTVIVPGGFQRVTGN